MGGVPVYQIPYRMNFRIVERWQLAVELRSDHHVDPDAVVVHRSWGQDHATTGVPDHLWGLEFPLAANRSIALRTKSAPMLLPRS
jgi:hypothetical protein